MKQAEWLQVKIEELRYQPTNECVEWPYSTNSNGYGMVSFYGFSTPAHRVAYILFYKCNPDNWVLHVCSNRLCFNPNHLYDGNGFENWRDQLLAELLGVDGRIPPHNIDEAKEVIKRHRQTGELLPRERRGEVRKSISWQD